MRRYGSLRRMSNRASEYKLNIVGAAQDDVHGFQREHVKVLKLAPVNRSSITFLTGIIPREGDGSVNDSSARSFFLEQRHGAG
jgi:hypothetical protein